MDKNKIDIDSLCESIASEAVEYSDDLNRLTVARLHNLALHDSHKKKGLESSKNIKSITRNIASNLMSNLDSSEATPSDKVLANHCCAELLGMKNSLSSSYSGIDFSKDKNAPEIDILKNSTIKDAALVGLLDCQNSNHYHRDIVGVFSDDAIEFLKKGQDIDALKQTSMLYTSMYNIEYSKSKYSNAVVAEGLPNLMATKTYEALSHKLSLNEDNDKGMAFTLYSNLGRDVSLNLYSQAVSNNNPYYAMSLLSSNKHGVLNHKSDYISNDPKVKRLLAMVIASDESPENLKKLAGIKSSENAKIKLFDNIIKLQDAQSKPNKDNLSSLIEGLGGNVTQTQVSQIALSLSENYNNTSVMPAFDSLIKKAQENNFESSQLLALKKEVEIKLNDEVGALDKPLSSYTTARIDFYEENKVIPLHSIRSVRHLNKVLEDGGVKNNELFELKSSGSYLDEKVVEAVDDYFKRGNKDKLDDAFSVNIKDLPLSSDDRMKILFDANKQQSIMNKELGKDELNNKLLSEIVKPNALVYNNGYIVSKLSDLKSSSDFVKSLNGMYEYNITTDDLGLGEDFNKDVRDLLNTVAVSKNNPEALERLDEALSIPASYLSSDIQYIQDNIIPQAQEKTVISIEDTSLDSEQDIDKVDKNAIRTTRGLR